MTTLHEADRYERRAHAMIATMASHPETPRPLDAAADRRENARRRLLSRGTLQVDDGTECREIVLYTRDADERGVGFLAAGELSPHTRGTIELTGPFGEPVEVTGELVRTRPVASGWHEGYVRFDTPVQLFCETPICAA